MESPFPLSPLLFSLSTVTLSLDSCLSSQLSCMIVSRVFFFFFLSLGRPSSGSSLVGFDNLKKIGSHPDLRCTICSSGNILVNSGPLLPTLFFPLFNGYL